MENFEIKFDQSYIQIKNLVAESIIPVGLARVNYIQEMANYEKSCKETEDLIREKKKKFNDPVAYYNLTQQKKVRVKIAKALKKLEASERQAEEVAERYNARQKNLNIALVNTMKLFKEAMKLLFENLVENIKRHNRIFQKFVKKEIEDCEIQRERLKEQGLNYNELDAEFIEQKAHEDDHNKSIRPPRIFLENINKLIESKEDLTEKEIYEYINLIKSHFEVALSIFKKRQRNIDGLREYIEGFNAKCNSIERTYQRLSKSWAYHKSTAVLVKQIGSSADPLFEGFDMFVSAFQQFSTFVNTKITLLEGIIQDLRTYLKIFENTVVNSLYEVNYVKERLGNLTLQHDKLSKTITDISEKNENDEKLPILRTQLENMTKEIEERKSELKALTKDAAKKVSQAFKDHQTHESSKRADLNNTINEVIHHKASLFKNLGDILNKIQGSLRPQEAGEEEIIHAIQTDFLINEYMPYIEGNPNAQNLKEKPVVFQRIYEPPTDIIPNGEDLDVTDTSGSGSASEISEKSSSLEKRFGYKNKEKPTNDFACAVESGIIRQGRMYIYPNAVCFSTVKLIGDFAIRIPIEDIVSLEKRTISLVFDTALTIVTKRGEVKFLSFFYRDKVYNIIQNLMKGVQEANVLSSPEQQSPLMEKEIQRESESSEFTNINPLQIEGEFNTREIDLLRQKSIDQEKSTNAQRKRTEESIAQRKKSLDLLEKRKVKVRDLTIADDQFPIEIAQETFECSALDIFNAMFADRQIIYKGKVFESSWYAAKVEAGDTEIKSSKWSPEVPLEGLEEDKETGELSKRVEKSQRGLSYTHVVRETGIFVPKTCPVEERHFGYWLGPDEFIIQNEVLTSKVPLSDCFVVRNCFKVKDIEGGKCQFLWRYGIHFVKSTVFKGKITKSSQDETVEYSKKIFMPILKEQLEVYLKTRGPKKLKSQMLERQFSEIQVQLKEETNHREVDNLIEEMEGVRRRDVEEKVKKSINRSLPVEEEYEELKKETEIKEEERPVQKEEKIEVLGDIIEKRLKEEMAKYSKVKENEKKEMVEKNKLMRNIIIILICVNALLALMFIFR